MTTNPGPLYLECTRGQSLATWAGAVLNAAIVAWCASWLLIHAQARPTGLVLLVIVLVGVFLGDLFTGFVHWMTDTWFDEVMLTRVVSIAREHHLHPYNIVGYSFRDYVGYTSWPAVMMFGPQKAPELPPEPALVPPAKSLTSQPVSAADTTTAPLP